MISLKKTLLASSLMAMVFAANAQEQQVVLDAPLVVAQPKAQAPAQAQTQGKAPGADKEKAAKPAPQEHAPIPTAKGGLIEHFAPGVGSATARDIAKAQSETALIRALTEQKRAQMEFATIKLELEKVGDAAKPVKTTEEQAKQAQEKEEADRQALIKQVREQVIKDLGGDNTAKGGDKDSDHGKLTLAPEPIPLPPSVVAIFGVGKNLYASFKSGNSKFDARRGDVIGDDYKVSHITSSEVTLTRKGKSVKLRVFEPADTKALVQDSGAHGQNLMKGVVPTNSGGSAYVSIQ